MPAKTKKIYEEIFSIYNIDKNPKARNALRNYIQRKFNEAFQNKNWSSDLDLDEKWQLLNKEEQDYFKYNYLKDYVLSNYKSYIHNFREVKRKIDNYNSDQLHIIEAEISKHNNLVNRLRNCDFYKPSDSLLKKESGFREFFKTLNEENSKIRVPDKKEDAGFFKKMFEEWEAANLKSLKETIDHRALRPYDWLLDMQNHPKDHTDDEYILDNTDGEYALNPIDDCSTFVDKSEIDHVIIQLLLIIIEKTTGITINTDTIRHFLDLKINTNYSDMPYEEFSLSVDPELAKDKNHPVSIEEQEEQIRLTLEYIKAIDILKAIDSINKDGNDTESESSDKHTEEIDSLLYKLRDENLISCPDSFLPEKEDETDS